MDLLGLILRILGAGGYNCRDALVAAVVVEALVLGSNISLGAAEFRGPLASAIFLVAVVLWKMETICKACGIFENGGCGFAVSQLTCPGERTSGGRN